MSTKKSLYACIAFLCSAGLFVGGCDSSMEVVDDEISSTSGKGDNQLSDPNCNLVVRKTDLDLDGYYAGGVKFIPTSGKYYWEIDIAREVLDQGAQLYFKSSMNNWSEEQETYEITDGNNPNRYYRTFRTYREVPSNMLSGLSYVDFVPFLKMDGKDIYYHSPRGGNSPLDSKNQANFSTFYSPDITFCPRHAVLDFTMDNSQPESVIPVIAGQPLTIRYDANRLKSECNDETRDPSSYVVIARWSLEANIDFILENGERQHRSEKLVAGKIDIKAVPANAKSVEIYFHKYSSGCNAWDSNNNNPQNYRYEVIQ